MKIVLISSFTLPGRVKENRKINPKSQTFTPPFQSLFVRLANDQIVSTKSPIRLKLSLRHPFLCMLVSGCWVVMVAQTRRQRGVNSLVRHWKASAPERGRDHLLGEKYGSGVKMYPQSSLSEIFWHQVSSASDNFTNFYLKSRHNVGQNLVL